jgi:hypothetical protein
VATQTADFFESQINDETKEKHREISFPKKANKRPAYTRSSLRLIKAGGSASEHDRFELLNFVSGIHKLGLILSDPS